jgi:AraC family transcriptional regulator
MRMEWLDRMNRALDYIERHLEEDVSIEEVAAAAWSSAYHFHRLFHMVTGLTVTEYIRRRRLTLAAQELASTQTRVVDVALKYGYDSPESFAKAFRRLHGISPSEARNPGVRLKAFPRMEFQLTLKGVHAMDYRMVEREAFHVIGKVLRTTTRDGENFREIPKFWNSGYADGWIRRLEALAGRMAMGVCLPMTPGQEDFSYMIGVEADPEKAGKEWAVCEVPALTWAVFTAVGPLPGSIQNTFLRIFQEWFPATNYEHAHGPELEVYLDGDSSSPDYRCEVWIPIEKK